MSFETYRDIKAVNWSSLKNMATSALLYRYRIDHPLPDKPAFALGRAVHCMVLETEKFDDRYTIVGSRRGKGAPKGPNVLTEKEFETVEACAMSVMGNDEAMALLDGTAREFTIQWTIDGMACKGRLDAVKPSVVVDLKTTRELKWFTKQAADLLYHGQGAFYGDGAIEAGICHEDVDVVDIAVETNEPYDCGVYRLSEQTVEAGRRLYEDLLARLRWCLENDLWPGQSTGVEDLELPPWAAGMEKEGEL